MKLDNRGWGLQELIVGLSVLIFCLFLAVILISKNFKELGGTLIDVDEPVQSRPVENEDFYRGLEYKMVEACKVYQKDLYHDLREGDKLTVTLKTLVRDQYLDKVDGDCSGYVTFEKENGSVIYTPYLKCGRKYQTKGYLEMLDSNG